jgi:hypothetical protein
MAMRFFFSRRQRAFFKPEKKKSGGKNPDFVVFSPYKAFRDSETTKEKKKPLKKTECAGRFVRIRRP